MEYGESGNAGGGKSASGSNRAGDGDGSAAGGKESGARMTKVGAETGAAPVGDKRVSAQLGMMGRAKTGEAKTQVGSRPRVTGSEKRVSVLKHSFEYRTNLVNSNRRSEFPVKAGQPQAETRDVTAAKVGSAKRIGHRGPAEAVETDGKSRGRTKAEKDTRTDVSRDYRYHTYAKNGKLYQVGEGWLHTPGTIKVHRDLGPSVKPGDYKVTGMVRGHLVGAQYGGSPRSENHAPQNSEINNGSFKRMELAQGKHLRQGYKVHWKAVSVKRIGENTPFARAAEARVYTPDGKTLLRTDRLYFTNHGKPPESDGTGVKGKLIGGAHRFARPTDHAIHVSKYQGIGKNGDAGNLRVPHRGFGKDNLLHDKFRSGAGKPEVKHSSADRLPSAPRRTEQPAERTLKEPSEVARKDAFETKKAIQIQRAHRFSAAQRKIKEAREQLAKDAKMDRSERAERKSNKRKTKDQEDK